MVWGSYLLMNEKMVSTQVGEVGNPSTPKLHAFLEDSWEMRQKDRLEPDCQELSTLVKGAGQEICSIFSRKIFRTLFVFALTQEPIQFKKSECWFRLLT